VYVNGAAWVHDISQSALAQAMPLQREMADASGMLDPTVRSCLSKCCSKRLSKHKCDYAGQLSGRSEVINLQHLRVIAPTNDQQSARFAALRAQICCS
jgi:hypothetical protein